MIDNNIITYSDVKGNQVTIIKDEYDYDVRLNGMTVITTGEETEAEMIAESLDIGLTILGMQGLLKNRD